MLLAQVAESPDVLLPLVLDALKGGNWWLAAPGIVWCVVWLLRRPLVVERVPLFGSKWGGLVLAVLASLAFAVVDLAASGATITVPVLLATLGKAAWALFGSTFQHTVTKRTVEAVKTPAVAAVK